MDIPVKVKSNITKRIIEGFVTPRKMLELLDEADLVDYLTKCNCQPVGETNLIECNCDEEWMDVEVFIGNEITEQKKEEDDEGVIVYRATGRTQKKYGI